MLEKFVYVFLKDTKIEARAKVVCVCVCVCVSDTAAVCVLQQTVHSIWASNHASDAKSDSQLCYTIKTDYKTPLFST